MIVDIEPFVYNVCMRKPIKQNPQYLIDSDGYIINSKTGKILSKNTNNRDYYMTTIKKKNGKYHPCTIHRLVAEAFIPNPENKPCVNHKNYDRLDNRLENLEWVTYSENNKHQWVRKVNMRNHNFAKLYPEDVEYIRTLEGRFKPSAIAELYNVTTETITNIFSKRTWKRNLE